MVFLRNMMGHMQRKEASLMALQLAEKLLPLVDDVRLPWGPKPHRRALCTDSSLQPSPVGSTRTGLPSRSPGLAFQGAGALQLWLHICPAAPAFRARLQSICPHISHATALAHRGQGAAVVEVPLSSSLPGVQPGAGALHWPLQRPDEDCGGEEKEEDEEDSAEGPAPAVPPYERPGRQRGRGALTSDRCCGVQGWPGHKGQRLLDVRVWGCVSPPGPTAPRLPCPGPTAAFLLPPAACCGGGWGAAVPSQPCSPCAALLQHSPEEGSLHPAGPENLAQAFPSPALPGPAGLSSSLWPPDTPSPCRLPSCPCRGGRPGL